MPRKLRWLGKGKRDRHGEAVAFLLMHPRRDASGNRTEGYTYEQLLALSDAERTVLKAQWLDTAEARKLFQQLCYTLR